MLVKAIYVMELEHVDRQVPKKKRLGTTVRFVNEVHLKIQYRLGSQSLAIESERKLIYAASNPFIQQRRCSIKKFFQIPCKYVTLQESQFHLPSGNSPTKQP